MAWHTTEFIMERYSVTRREILDAVTAWKIVPLRKHRYSERSGRPVLMNHYTEPEVEKIMQHIIENRRGEWKTG